MMKRLSSLCVLSLAVMLIPDVVMAQACPGNAGAAFDFALVQNVPNTATTFIGTGCDTAKVGGSHAPTTCWVENASFHRFRATWANTAARTNAVSPAGCSFMCGIGTMKSNTCFVRATDGLPVELMEFSVE